MKTMQCGITSNQNNKEQKMKALEILYQYKQADEEFGNSYSMGERLEEAIKELEEYESDIEKLEPEMSDKELEVQEGYCILLKDNK